MKKLQKINVIGGGLAGSECAFRLAELGYSVVLYDIKPNSFTPAHSNTNYGELVCSNSLKSNDVYGNACGLLKEELRILGSMVIECADGCKVPAGNALAVNREDFAHKITQKIKNHPNIECVCKEVEELNLTEPTVIATGPLTTDKLSSFISRQTGKSLYFFDAAAPIVSAESIDMDNAFVRDRYGELGVGDYINCPINKEAYEEFYNALITAERAKLHDFEDVKVFEGCMPIEIMAKRGPDTLRFGPLKPTGLDDPKTGRWPYACLQLRKEDVEGNMYNLVGFQTNLTFAEQKRVFGIIPALKNAEFLRYGVMHRNTYINAPEVLNSDFSMKQYPLTFFAGQISGVEGYVESIASGLMCAIHMDRKLQGKEALVLDNTTVIGALSNYVATENSDFQPMNSNYGILAPLGENIRNKKDKKALLSKRAIENIKKIKEIINE